jgi:hypothetical protein
MANEVGIPTTVFGRLFVRWMVNGPGGTVITTGDHVPAGAAAFEAAQVAGATAAAEQV